MNNDIERVEQYLQAVDAPDCVSDSHRAQLRQRILEHVGIGRRRRWDAVAALAALICIAGAVGVFIIAREHAVGQGPAGIRQLADETVEHAPTPSTPDMNGVTNGVQVAQALQDVDAAREKDSAELVQVIESEVNGRLANRMFIPKRALSSSQMRAISEAELNNGVQSLLVTLPAATRTEMSQLRRAGKAEKLAMQERQMKGRVFLFNRERYTLHDGTTVTLSVGEPKDVKQSLPPAREANQP